MGLRGELFSTRASSEKRNYFFNVKENRRGDMFLNIVESKRAEDAVEVDRHQIVVYQEELEDFYNALTEAVEHIKSRRWQGFRQERDRRHDTTRDAKPAAFKLRDPNASPDSSPPTRPAGDSVSPSRSAEDSVPPGAAAADPPQKPKIRKVIVRREKSSDEPGSAPDRQ